ncbi:MAG TPA: CDP-tyvelose epimerase [Rhodopirellula baltica]|uniref:Probable CDP-tyvelose epimerase n=2 Tax=Rhodopirellula baltica TaxID=265606 RepID=Q7UMC8_RHOBA|nr:probable CDP-tyvelose epimerase [Rhodopirellula baltica SH 1]HBE65281.1 CDP-tyvelose epimerase [Rhodopirellula baltica]
MCAKFFWDWENRVATRVFITGICGFVGNMLAKLAAEHNLDWEISGIDNLARPGSDINRRDLMSRGINVVHGDLRNSSDLDCIGDIDWVIDAAAKPSVLAGVDGQTSSRQLVEHNLIGTLNVLELCKRSQAGLVLLSSSRVYSIHPLAKLSIEIRDGAYVPKLPFPKGMTEAGISESFSTTPPVSLYGSTKRASEQIALEYAATFGFPCLVNRCGILAGAGQFGRPDQGIIAFWIHSHQARRSLHYTGFDALGHQVRDCLHPRDLLALITRQMQSELHGMPLITNVSGGVESAVSLQQLTAWCDRRFGIHPVSSQHTNRPFDLPWVVLDNKLAKETWGWRPETEKEEIFAEIADYAEQNPDWLDISS